MALVNVEKREGKGCDSMCELPKMTLDTCKYIRLGTLFSYNACDK